MSVLAAVAAAGAAYGMWALLGYAVGDLTLGRHPGLFLGYVKTGSPIELVYGLLPVLFSYLLLAGLLVWGPLAGMAVRGLVGVRFRGVAMTSVGASYGAQLVAQSLVVFIWAQGTAVLIRPVWTAQGSEPDPAGVSPLQQGAPYLAATTALVLLARAALVIYTVSRQPGTRRSPHRRPSVNAEVAAAGARRDSGMIGALVRALIAFALLWGLYESVLEAIVSMAVLVVAFLGQQLIPARKPAYVRALDRVPFPVRIAAVAAGGYVLTLAAAYASQAIGDNSLTVLLVGMLVTIVLGAAVLPRSSAGARRP